MAIVGAVFFSLWMTAPAEAVMRVWKDGVTGDWNVAGNWMNGLPMPGDTVYLGKTDDGHKVTLAGAGASVAAVYGGSGLTIDAVPLTVTGSATDVTSFERVSAVNGGSVSITGPGHYQGGLTLGTATSSASLTISGAGVKWSGAVLEGATGSGTTTLTPTADVTVEPFTNLQILTRFQNRGKLHTDVLTEIIPSPGSLASDGDFEASATGTISVSTAVRSLPRFWKRLVMFRVVSGSSAATSPVGVIVVVPEPVAPSRTAPDHFTPAPEIVSDAELVAVPSVSPPW